MAYTRKSIGRPAGGAGNPMPKMPTIELLEDIDVLKYPSRELGVTKVTEGFELKADVKPFGIYATQSTIEILQEEEGEADAKGYKKGVKFEHPGNATESEDCVEYYANKRLIAIIRSSDGQSKRIIGSRDNPLVMKVETTETKEGTKKTFTLQQEIRDQCRIMDYTGEIPEPDPTAAAPPLKAPESL